MERSMNKIILTAFVGFVLAACNLNTRKNTTSKEAEINEGTMVSSSVSGNYVDDNYVNRGEGDDWVAVSVKDHKDDTIIISIRSRADKKKPSCTFDTKARKKKKNTYEAVVDDKKIIFSFIDQQLEIATEKPENSSLLAFFCNGGASIGGTYTLIDEALDASQIDATAFSKVMKLQGVGFNVSAVQHEGKNTLTVRTFGLQNREYNENFIIEGEQVIDAEVEDLNADGSPELFVYTKSLGSGSYGQVYAFSVNNLKSMSRVFFQPTSENEKINEGYRGNDDFTVVENNLVQRFQIYNENDANTKPTGGMRQVTYKLVEGEAMRKLEVHQMNCY